MPNHKTLALFTLSASLVFLSPSRADDVQDGTTAFKKGDYATAVRLLTPLAQKSDAVAELYIGLMHFSGNGLPKDRVEAAKWFLASARQGQAGAQTDIGIAYAAGEGMPQNRKLAYMWFSLAAESGSEYAKEYRDHIATELTPDELREANQLVEECRNSNFQHCEET